LIITVTSFIDPLRSEFGNGSATRRRYCKRCARNEKREREQEVKKFENENAL